MFFTHSECVFCVCDPDITDSDGVIFPATVVIISLWLYIYLQ